MTAQLALSPVDTPANWKGSQIDYRKDGMIMLSDAEADEIDAALKSLCANGAVDLPAITRESFPLATLGRRLAELGKELRFGRGFVLLRGLDRSRYGADELAYIFYGIGVHLGEVIPQSGDGELLGHVLNVNDLVEGPVRGYRSAQSMNMHSDGHDIVGLLCLQAAKSGGASRISSAVAVFNRMLELRPDLVEVLAEGMKIKRMEKDAERGDGRIVTQEPVALFSGIAGEFCACIHAAQVRDAATGGAFDMTREQSEALDLLCQLAASDEFVLDMTIGEGDIQFLNNRLILHGRLDYEDHPELERRRHLLRLWLKMPSWPDRPVNQQDIYSPDDLQGWARHRTPAMDLPSRYFARMAGRPVPA